MIRRLALLAVLLAAPSARADEVVMAIGRSLPPYVIADEWRGLEYDVVREALALEGHTLQPRFMAFARVLKEMETAQVDAAMTMRPDSGIRAFYSASHVTYRNYAITLASRRVVVDGIGDLAGKSVMAFQNAALYLGPEYRAVVEASPHYREEARQALQPTMLFLGRIDVVVADRFIFGWFAGDPEVKAKVDTTQAVRFHPVFPPTDYHVAFRDAALRDSFDRGLKKLRESGTYDKIVARYSGFLEESAGD
jgi:ABC-type amino acid transport/signal transduction systems, periplasmic component/domain